MFPWVNGFEWQAGHLIFLGAFFAVALGIAMTVLTALQRARFDLASGRAEEIRWMADFPHLPASARLCRASLTGRGQRLCSRGFDCGSCPVFAAVSAQPLEACAEEGEITINGLRYELDRAYDRGHTWVCQDAEDTVTVGLDPMALRLVGDPDAMELPPPGSSLRVHGTALELRRNGSTFRILSPVAGTVLDHGGRASGWLLRVKTDRATESMKHLLRGQREVRSWVLREMERLQGGGREGGVGLALADGGELVQDLSRNLPHREWDELCGEMLLDL